MDRMRRNKTLALAIAPILLAAGTAAAQPAPGGGGQAAPAGAPQKPAWQIACEPDVEKLCKEEVKTGKVFECLTAKEEALASEECRSFVWKLKIAQTCQEDFDKYCKPPLPEGKTRGQCIKENEKNLSEKCRTALVRGSKRQKAEEKAATKAEAAEKAEPAAAEAAEKPARKKRVAAKKK